MNNNSQTGGRARAWALLILGVIYLALVVATFAFGINLATDRAMQAVLHFTVILSAIAYVLFADAIYAARADKADARPALLFAALFAVLVIAARCVGLTIVSTAALYMQDGIFNFYAPASLTRTVELAGWTVLYPLSMLFLVRLFKRAGRKVTAALALASALCCFIGFFSFVSPAAVFLYIGLLGWGPLFLAVVIAYMAGPLRDGTFADAATKER